jgi:hypothetical protein
VLLTGSAFDEIGQAWRKFRSGERQRGLRVDVTLATASGGLMDASIHHFASGGVGLITAAPLQPGEHFGFEVPQNSGTLVLFCEVLACRSNANTFMVNASFLEQEASNTDGSAEITNQSSGTQAN